MERLILFLKDFDWTLPDDPNTTIGYKFGMEVEVEEDCADAAVTNGFATFVEVFEDDEAEADGLYNFQNDDEAE